MRKNKKNFSVDSTLSDFLSRPVRWVAVFIAMVGVLFPLYWLFSNAVKVPAEYLQSPPVLIPSRVIMENFTAIFEKYGATRGLINTAIVALVTTVICVFLGSLAAYAIAKGTMARKIRNIFALCFMVQKMYPAISVAIPVYLVMLKLKLIDTPLALIIMNTSFNLPLVVWLMIGFFQDVPSEMEQSGKIDGCSMWQRFIYLVLPITKPGLVASGILTFVAAWNEFLFAAILSINKAKTLSISIAGFITDRGLEWGPMAAMGVIMIIPVTILVWIVQKDFVAGLAMGSVKE